MSWYPPVLAVLIALATGVLVWLLAAVVAVVALARAVVAAWQAAVAVAARRL